VHTLQALSMREAGDTVKMLRKQSILWSGESKWTIWSTSTWGYSPIKHCPWAVYQKLEVTELVSYFLNAQKREADQTQLFGQAHSLAMCWHNTDKN